MAKKIKIKAILNFLSEFSLPLIFGVILAIFWANVNEHGYHDLIHAPIYHFADGTPLSVLGHEINFHFLMNDIFMVFFFGIATVEITQSVLPGGDLNPFSKALNPLLGTVGGVLGPAAFYVLFATILAEPGQDLTKGWGIPTATDIALAWLVARLVFGSRHSAVSFLLLLAIVDDAIGLVIITIFYPDAPPAPVFLLFTLGGMAVSFGLRKINVKSFWPYLILGGTLSWVGLLKAHLHPALAPVFIVPFMPAAQTQKQDLLEHGEKARSTLENFEHSFKYIVDFGLLGFGLANAGVPFSDVNNVTWAVFLALLVGKMVGISGFSYLASKLGLPLPEGMGKRSLIVTSIIAGLGLTVALFVAGQAFKPAKDATADVIAKLLPLENGAKMGAIFSGGIAIIAIVVARVLGIKRLKRERTD